MLLGWRIVAFTRFRATESLRWNLERLQMSYATLYFLVAAVVLWRSYRKAGTPLQQQQLKWISRGTVLAIGPYTLFYVLPYLGGSIAHLRDEDFGAVAGVPAGDLRLRHRPLPADGRGHHLQARHGLHAGHRRHRGGLLCRHWHLAGSITTKYPGTGTIGLIAVIIITALIFEPLKNWIQVRLDRFFYRKRYDYRRTLIEFGRELSSETDLHAMLTSVIDRLSRTLLVDRIAIFLARTPKPMIS